MSKYRALAILCLCGVIYGAVETLRQTGDESLCMALCTLLPMIPGIFAEHHHRHLYTPLMRAGDALVVRYDNDGCRRLDAKHQKQLDAVLMASQSVSLFVSTEHRLDRGQVETRHGSWVTIVPVAHPGDDRRIFVIAKLPIRRAMASYKEPIVG